MSGYGSCIFTGRWELKAQPLSNYTINQWSSLTCCFIWHLTCNCSYDSSNSSSFGFSPPSAFGPVSPLGKSSKLQRHMFWSLTLTMLITFQVVDVHIHTFCSWNLVPSLGEFLDTSDFCCLKCIVVNTSIYLFLVSKVHCKKCLCS